MTETPVDGCAITKPTGRQGVGQHQLREADRADRREELLLLPSAGTSAPFSLTNYDDVAANAAMIAEVVDQRRMPPWYASPGIGKFTNDRTMPAADRKLLLAWAHAGATHDVDGRIHC